MELTLSPDILGTREALCHLLGTLASLMELMGVHLLHNGIKQLEVSLKYYSYESSSEKMVIYVGVGKLMKYFDDPASAFANDIWDTYRETMLQILTILFFIRIGVR